MHKIAVVVGSLRKDSFNKKLMLALNKLNHPKLEFNILDIKEIPLFNQDNESNLPAAVVKLKSEVSSADGILFVTPEYNRSIPGVLKNIIDWAARPYGQNSWANKPTAIIGTSPGSVGTAVAQAHLRSIMVALGAILLGQPEIYIVYKNELIDAMKPLIANFDTYKNNIDDAIKLIEENYHGKFDSEEDFAYYWTHEVDCREIPDYLQHYIDYKAMARDFFVNDFFSLEIDHKVHVFSHY